MIDEHTSESAVPSCHIGPAAQKKLIAAIRQTMLDELGYDCNDFVLMFTRDRSHGDFMAVGSYSSALEIIAMIEYVASKMRHPDAHLYDE